MTSNKNKSLLYIAFHYPPIIGSSGAHRTLAFTRYLSNQGWMVNLLTTKLDAYVQWDKSKFELIPEKVTVIRAFAKDTARHLSFKGRYFDFMAIPDRWQSWIPFAVLSGLWAIRKSKCKVIVSTYPIASAHIIAYVLHKLTGLPWVADLRDPMAQVDYPADAGLKKVFFWIEKKMVAHCKRVLLTASGAKALYTARYPDSSPDLWEVLPNGYDEELIDRYLATNVENVEHPPRSRIRLLHSGTLYPIERDPTFFFQAIAELKKEDKHLAECLDVWLRATGTDKYHLGLLDRYDIADIVTVLPSLSYENAIKDMQSADALLLMQSDGCNYQIPAKAYEYIRVKRPILALTDPTSDSAELMRKTNVAIIAPLNDVSKIKLAIVQLIKEVGQADHVYFSDENIRRFSRKTQAIKLEKLLTEII